MGHSSRLTACFGLVTFTRNCPKRASLVSGSPETNPERGLSLLRRRIRWNLKAYGEMSRADNYLQALTFSHLLSEYWFSPRQVEVLSDRYLVDPASSHMLVSKIKPCMSKNKPNMVNPRMAHYNSHNLLDLKSLLGYLW